MTVGCAQRLQQPLVELLFADTWLNHNDFKLGSQVLRGGQKGPKGVSPSLDDLGAIPPRSQASLQARQAGRRYRLLRLTADLVDVLNSSARSRRLRSLAVVQGDEAPVASSLQRDKIGNLADPVVVQDDFRRRGLKLRADALVNRSAGSIASDLGPDVGSGPIRSIDLAKIKRLEAV